MNATTQTTEELKQHLTQSLKLLATLRDEIRLEIHLAGMDAKEQWKKLDGRFSDAERHVREATANSRAALEELVGSFKVFRAALKNGSRDGEQPSAPPRS